MNVKVCVMMGILEITRQDNVNYVNLHVRHVIMVQIKIAYLVFLEMC